MSTCPHGRRHHHGGRTAAGVTPPSPGAIAGLPVRLRGANDQRLYALLYAPDLLAAAGETQRAAQVKDMVAAGVQRLWSMQTRDGGLSYWRRRRICRMASAYVAEFLLAARRAGHTVEPRFRTSCSSTSGRGCMPRIARRTTTIARRTPTTTRAR